MKRRAFLGFMGGAAVAGPTAAKDAAAAPFSNVTPGGVAMNAVMDSGPQDAEGNSVEYAKGRLKALLGKSERQIAYEKRTRGLSGLDAEVSGLRSVSLQHKIRMSRDRAYERGRRTEQDSLLGTIEGWLK